MFKRGIAEKEHILINLLPQDREGEKRRKKVVAGAAVLVVVLAVLGWWTVNMMKAVKQEEMRNRELRQQLKIYAGREQAIDYAQLKSQVEKKRMMVEKLEGQKIYYGSFLEVFQDINSSSPYISYMEVKPGYVNLEGSGKDYDETLAYLEWLLGQEDVVIIEKLATYTAKDTGRLNFQMSVRWESGK